MDVLLFVFYLPALILRGGGIIVCLERYASYVAGSNSRARTRMGRMSIILLHSRLRWWYSNGKIVMCTAVELTVPVKVDVECGKNWKELEAYPI